MEASNVLISAAGRQDEETLLCGQLCIPKSDAGDFVLECEPLH